MKLLVFFLDFTSKLDELLKKYIFNHVTLKITCIALCQFIYQFDFFSRFKHATTYNHISGSSINNPCTNDSRVNNPHINDPVSNNPCTNV